MDHRHFGYTTLTTTTTTITSLQERSVQTRTNELKERELRRACLLASFLSLDLPLFSLRVWVFLSVYKRLASPRPILYFLLPSQLSELPCSIHWKPLICCYKFVFLLPDLVVARLHHITVTVQVLGIWRERERERESVCVCVCVCARVCVFCVCVCVCACVFFVCDPERV